MSSGDTKRGPTRGESVRPNEIVRGFTSRVRLKPRRDALTRARHDLRSLVHALVGYSSLLAAESHGALSKEQKGFVTHLQTAALEIGQLVDACVELSRPADAASSANVASTTLAALLARSHHCLTSNGVSCSPLQKSPIGQRELAIDADRFERGLLELARLVSSQGAEPCALSLYDQGASVLLTLCVAGRSSAHELESPDALANELSNRDFIRLKHAEALLTRDGAQLRLTCDRKYAELTLG
jgi:hypothetical protein